jgi:Chlorophyll A-B binding protein
MIAEGEGVGHSGDNFRGMGTKTPGDMGFDYLGLKSKLSPDRQDHFRKTELTNGRAAMIAMASLFSFKAIPGSVPLMDLLGAN